MPAQAGIQGREGVWIPAFAGMTEQRVVIDAQIIAAHVFSKESTRFGVLIFRKLRDLRGKQTNLNDTHDPQKWLMSQLERERFKWKNYFLPSLAVTMIEPNLYRMARWSRRESN